VTEDRLRAQIATLHWTLGSGLIKDWGVALDCGAYEGHWALAMAKCFKRVLAFEPSHFNFVRASENLREQRNVELYEMAVLDRTRRAKMVESKSKHSAAHYVQTDDNGVLEAWGIDNLNLLSCGLIKLDVEGAEFEAIKGARKTIDKFRPVLIVEIKGLETRFGHPVGSVRRLLSKMRYSQVHAARPDFVFAR